MRIALIADIHGNLVALDAVLTELSGEQVDQMICLGDIAATGPQPQAVVERVQQLGCPVVMGNADAELIGREPYPTGTAARFGDMDRWCAAQLSAAALDYIRAFPATFALSLDSGALDGGALDGGALDSEAKAVCFHGSPRSYNDVITATTPDPELAEMLGDVQASLLAGGHTHFQMVRRYATMVVLNPGSVGLAYNRTPGTGETRIAPWAEYAVITYNDNRLGIDLRRTPFDAAVFRQLLLESGMPHADWWAQKLVP